jgi:hypothetical protein
MSDQQETTRPTEGSEPPPWWDEFTTGSGSNGLPPPRGLPDLSPLIALVEAMRRVVPLELQEQFNALQRELLLTVRALIDWYLERLDGSARATVVEDIPID